MTADQDRHDTLQGLLVAWRRADPLRLGGARWAQATPWALAGLASLGLLVSLALVVQNIVSEAALRHAATAVQTDALWRCNTLRARESRDQCRRVAGPAAPLTLN